MTSPVTARWDRSERWAARNVYLWGPVAGLMLALSIIYGIVGNVGLAVAFGATAVCAVAWTAANYVVVVLAAWFREAP